jgi:DeoR/GlpR family transcriptional regulator of sugar metabolism
VDSFHTDYAFISCRGVDLTAGVTESSEDEAAVKIACLRNAARTVLLCDSSKLDKKYFCKVCDLSQLWDIVSNDDLPQVYEEKTGFSAAKSTGR